MRVVQVACVSSLDEEGERRGSALLLLQRGASAEAARARTSFPQEEARLFSSESGASLRTPPRQDTAAARGEFGLQICCHKEPFSALLLLLAHGVCPWGRDRGLERLEDVLLGLVAVPGRFIPDQNACSMGHCAVAKRLGPFETPILRHFRTAGHPNSPAADHPIYPPFAARQAVPIHGKSTSVAVER